MRPAEPGSAAEPAGPADAAGPAGAGSAPVAPAPAGAARAAPAAAVHRAAAAVHRPAPAGGAAPPTGGPAPLSTGGTGGAGGKPSPAGGRAHPHRPAAGPPASRTAHHHPAPTLRAHHLTLTYPGGLTALQAVDLTLHPAQITALVGPNGAGKSTLFDCLAGTLRPTSGRVTLGTADITTRPAHTRARLGIGRTFQQLAVFPSLTVEENVRVGADHDRTTHPAVEQALRLVGLAGSVRHRTAAGLPTGTLRRVELARALAGGPHTLLLDEPAAGLDAEETAALARILAALAADGLTVLVVEHDPDLVAGIARTVHTMEGGRIVS